MHLYREYFDLVASGRKTIEVRVRYPRMGSPRRRGRGPVHLRG